jgi:cellobiose-specific phosphotransferase system component IIA
MSKLKKIYHLQLPSDPSSFIASTTSTQPKMFTSRFAKKDRYATAMATPIETVPAAPRPPRVAIDYAAEFAAYEREAEPKVTAPPALTIEDLEYEEFRREDAAYEDQAYEEPVYEDEDDDTEYDNIGRGRNVVGHYIGRTEANRASKMKIQVEPKKPNPLQVKKPAGPRTPITGWSADSSSKIGAQLAEYAPDSEEDIEVDEIDMVTGLKSPQQLRVNNEIRGQVVHAIQREEPQNPVLEKKKIMQGAYEKNGKLFGDYFTARITLPEVRGAERAALARPAARQVKKQITPKINSFAALDEPEVVEEPEVVDVVEEVTVDKAAILRFCEKTATEEAEAAAATIEEDETDETDESSAESTIVTREPEASPEVLERVATKIAMIKARIDARKAKTDAERQARLAASKPDSAQTNTKKSRAKLTNTKQLTNELFYNKGKIAENETRVTLSQVHAPDTLMTLVGMITKKPEEMVKCRDDANYMVPLPPLASTTDVMVASPTQSNVLHTPPIVSSLCRSGNECQWYRKQAHEEHGAPVPQHLQNARVCHFMHVSREPLTLEMPAVGATEKFAVNKQGEQFSLGWSRTEPVQFVQCSIQGCTQEQHYLPHDDERIHVVHMTPMSETCTCTHCDENGYKCNHDGRNFCQNALVEGCCRRHQYSGPVLATLLMRALLNRASTDPYKWPTGDYTALSGLWRQIVSIKVPGTDNDMGDRFRMKGIWPSAKPAYGMPAADKRKPGLKYAARR